MNATATQWERISTVNGRPWDRKQIGWHVIGESDFTEYGEYAAYYCTITVPAGRYPIYACRDCGSPWHSVMIPMEGVIKSGSSHEPRKAKTYTLNLYPHQLAARVLYGQYNDVELFDGVEAKEIHFDWKGEPQVTHGIFVDGEQV